MRASGSVWHIVEHEEVPILVLHHVLAFVLKRLLDALVARNAGRYKNTFCLVRIIQTHVRCPIEVLRA